jgi:salicylate hydroxylase
VLELGARLEEFAAHVNGVSVLGRRGSQVLDERGIALIGADGIWSTVGAGLRRQPPPTFRHRTAWRALVPADAVPAEFRQPLVHLWLGMDAHLVHYPVRAGSLINIVGIVHDEWNETGWTAAGDRNEILRHFARWAWSEKARALIAIPERWLKWALYDRREPFRGTKVPVTLIGDAAHPMLPFLAQGASMAIEDAVVVADMLDKYLDDPADALRAYEGARWHRTARAQQFSRRQSRIYGLTGPEAFARNLAMRAMGGEKLRARYDWLYSWRPPQRYETIQA